LEKIVFLIKDMLAIDVSKRLSSTEVVRRLGDILQQHQENHVAPIETPQVRRGESTVGATALGKIESVTNP
jgi:hypothetical protein